MPVSIALMTFNASVNSGPSLGARLLQRALNDLNQNLVVDGEVGPKTLGAANSVDVRSAVERYSQIHENFYRGLSKFNVFGRGWLNRLSDVTTGALNLIGKTPGSTIGERPMPSSDPTRPASPVGGISDIENIVTHVAEIVRLMQQTRTQNSPPTDPAPGNQATPDMTTILQALLAITGQMDGTTKPQPGSPKAEPVVDAENQPLTPV